jgi:arabinofuranosyltransferase
MTAVAPAVAEPPAAWYRRPSTWVWAALAATLALYAVLAWRRRWMSDDGLLVLRTVRQILVGHGPVFNVGERVEASTSPLWTWLLAGAGGITGATLEWLAVVLGLVCAVGGLFFGLDGARRLYGGATVVPAGGLVVCALPPFRDFATSGLETGLALLWIGLTWWLLVRGKAPFATAVVLGLGPLVRPDLALFSIVAFAALVLLRRPGVLRGAAWFGAGVALPLAYQVFRMGFYGLLVPNTALAKEAGDANWARGFAYLLDLAGPYYLWVPLLLLAAVVALTRRSRILTLAPVLAAVLLTVYVVRVGGDFMHARMLLPALFSLLLPVMAVPLTRRTVALLAAVAVWSVAAAGWLRVPYANEHLSTGVTDERAYWSWDTGNPHPVLASDFLGQPIARAAVEAVDGTHKPAVLVYSYDEKRWYTFPAGRPYVTMATDSMGAISNLVSLDVRVHDGYGLASDLAAHTVSIPGGRPGHSKWLIAAWEIADAGRGDFATDGLSHVFSPADIDAARQALRCPGLQDVLASTRTPLTFSRFVDNLTGAAGRTQIRFDRDPHAAAAC